MALPTTALKYANARYGVVTDKVLREAGMLPRRVRRMVERDELVRSHTGVYVIGGSPRTWEQAQLAACLASDGVASHRAAMRLWTPKMIRDARDLPVEVTVPARRCPRLADVVVHRSKDLAADELGRRREVPVTSPLRMLADLASVVDQDQLGKVVDECVVTRLLTIEGVRAALHRATERRARGVSLLREVVEDWPVGDTRPDSVLELALARLIKRAGLPLPVFQHQLTLDGRARRVDFAYPDLMMAIEVDGFEARTDRGVFQGERWRQNDLVQAGWTILRFTWHDVMNRPDYVAYTIQEAVSAAARQVGGLASQLYGVQ